MEPVAQASTIVPIGSSQPICRLSQKMDQWQERSDWPGRAASPVAAPGTSIEFEIPEPVRVFRDKRTRACGRTGTVPSREWIRDENNLKRHRTEGPLRVSARCRL